MFNKTILMGRICNDLELKAIQSGISVLTFRIAVDRAYQIKGEERKTDFFNIVAWRSTAEFIHKYFSKGRMILVEGELQTRQYIDKNNVTQNIVELVVSSVHFTGEPKPEGVRGDNVPLPASPPAVGQGTASFSAEGSSDEDFFEAEQDDDYPF